MNRDPFWLEIKLNIKIYHCLTPKSGSGIICVYILYKICDCGEGRRLIDYRRKRYIS